ncbi:MAG: GNAT family N-acetyltransferase [Chloroflexi bacterium]|nr:GNAT family N-acetyltransferase [Chloroflexota bacterium]
MHIYRADLRDLAACLALDGSYDTDFVRQVTQVEEDAQVVTRFRVAALPRTMHVAYPSWGEALLAHQERGDLILVAAEAAEVRGYINVETQPDQSLAWLHHLVIAPVYRRQGIGAALLARGIQHARQQSLSQMMTLVQSKNHPAIKFLERNRFAFCGYNERFYRNKDIGLYFVRGL